MHGCGRPDIFDRQVKRESRTGARRAAQMNFTTEQTCQFTADGEAETGAAVLAAGRGVGLLERFEDDFLLFQRDAYAGIGNLEGDNGRRLAEHGVLRAPASGGRVDRKTDTA